MKPKIIIALMLISLSARAGELVIGIHGTADSADYANVANVATSSVSAAALSPGADSNKLHSALQPSSTNSFVSASAATNIAASLIAQIPHPTGVPYWSSADGTEFATVEPGATCMLWRVTGPHTNGLFVTLSDDFEETVTHTRPAWTNNVFPFVDGDWNGFGSFEYGNVIQFSGDASIPAWFGSSLLVGSSNAAGTATLWYDIVYITNLVSVLATSSQLAAKADATNAIHLVVTNGINVSTQTVPLSGGTFSLSITPASSSPSSIHPITAASTNVALSASLSVYALTLTNATLISLDGSALATSLGGTNLFDATLLVNVAAWAATGSTFSASVNSSYDFSCTGCYKFAISSGCGTTFIVAQTYPALFRRSNCMLSTGALNDYGNPYVQMFDGTTTTNGANFAESQDWTIDQMVYVTGYSGASVTNAVYLSCDNIRFSAAAPVPTNYVLVSRGIASDSSYGLYATFFVPKLSTTPYERGYKLIFNMFSTGVPGTYFRVSSVRSRPATDLETRAYNSGWRP